MQGDFRVGELVVRPELNWIEDGEGGGTNVEPRSMEVLAYLAAHAGELCTRQQVLEAVWDETFVGEEALTHCVWDLRRAFGDEARQPRYIQTLPRRGYRLLARVSWLREAGQESRYRLIEEIGAGTMGVVWRAEDTRLGRVVALKFLPPEWSHDARSKERFMREARAAAALDHPNLCTLHEIDETQDGRLFLVMPFYEGKTLDALAAGGPVPWRRAATIIAGAARGLAAAHARGIVHRDVKPANLMVLGRDDGDQVKVLDFGVARFGSAATRLTATSFSPGTPAYKSPEQSRGEEVDCRSDVWSLGVVLYELVSGRPPFRGEYEQAVVYAILEGSPEPLTAAAPETPRTLAAIAERALAKDPDQRFQSMTEMAADLDAVLTGSGTVDAGATVAPPVALPRAASVAPITGSPHTAPAPGRAWQRLALAATGVAVAAVVSFGAYLTLRPTVPPLRVAVLRPTIEGPTMEGQGAELKAAVSGVRLAVIAGLASLRDLSPLDPSEHREAANATAAARAAAADEVLGATVEARGALCRVSLRRVSADGRVLWADAVEAPIDPAESLLLASAISAKLRQAYPDHPPREGSPGLEVTDADYRIYLDIRQRHDAGTEASAETLATLDAILETSPRFLEGHLFAAEMAWRLARQRREPELLERAAALARASAALAPNDPRPLHVSFRIALAAERTEVAEGVLARLEQLFPGSPSTLFARSQLLAQRGDLESAIRLSHQIVALRPSWKLLFHLATLEDRGGDPDAARGHLRQLLERSPGNRRGLSRLAELELVYGELDAARELYESLLEHGPSRRYRTNLGIVFFLLGDYRSAVDTYRRALELAPYHGEAMFNLAEAQAALGREQEAKAGYGRVLERLEHLEEGADLDPTDRMLKALCLAHLGRARSAVRETQETLQAHPENAEVVYQGAMVYALTADRNSALVNVERALELGTQPRWFRVPAFAALTDDPAFQALLERAGARPPDQPSSGSAAG